MGNAFCVCGRKKARATFVRCDECSRLVRRKPRPLCACGCGKTCGRIGWTYASVACQKRDEYASYIACWKAGEEDGKSGLGISNHIRRYMIETRGERCERCGWAERNLYTGNIPLTIDHIDGNWENNAENNLKLLCPNCHALTPTFGGANRGNGRKSRGAIRYEPSQDRTLTG